MSKYIAIIDLPDDDRCRGCTLLNEVQDWCYATEAHIDLIEWGNPMNWIRNLDCPLIPVDRVMKGLTDLEVAMTGDDWRANPIDSVRDILRDELGVTE